MKGNIFPQKKLNFWGEGISQHVQLTKCGYNKHHYYKMWMQFISPRSLQLVNSLKI
jgi:Zn ribbon nucleic-acid-binding protein